MRMPRGVSAFALAMGAYLLPFGADACDCSQGGDFRLWYVDSTTTEIAVAWQSVRAATSYVLERSTACDFSAATSYTLSPFITAYGDTGQEPDNLCRFPASDWHFQCTAAILLSPGTAYTYRVRALSTGAEQISNCVTAQVAGGPTRGVAGDLWADVVLGKPDFGQNAFLKTNAKGTEEPGGILIDKRPTGHPDRVYVADPNHNRILGFDHLGTCAGQPCTSDRDCAGGTCVLDYPNLLPSVVLGQESFTDKGACNGDGTGQVFPARVAASATSLCLIVPTQISIQETIFSSLMDTDDTGALYVPDIYNNRVLRYADPFARQAADAVFGQDDFAGSQCNRGQPNPNCRSLCLENRHAGVAIDDVGNLWVADPQNARVLRFPKCPLRGVGVCSRVPPGHIAPEADVVLGQPDCTTNVRGDVGRPLNQLCYPLDVAFDKTTRTLYVADAGDDRIESRILKFRPDRRTGDFITGSSGARLPVQLPKAYPGRPPQLCYKRPIEITLDTQSRGLWVRQDTDVCTELVDVTTGRPSHTVPQFGGPIRGIDVDELGNLLVTDAWYGVLRLQRQAVGMGAPEKVFVGDPFSGDSFFTATGVAVLSDPAGGGPDQLIVSDMYRMLIWNNYDLATLRSGQGADDVYGAADFNDGSNLFRQYFYYPQVYGGRLWAEKGPQGELLAFDYPLCGSKWQESGIGCTQPSNPSRSIPVGPVNGFIGYPLLGAPTTTVLASPPDAGDLDFAPANAGDAVWVADRWNNRVFRVAGLNGPDSPHVDVILGQADANGTQCARGLSNPRADTLCIPYDVALDAGGNVYVGDNGGEVGSDRRILEFDAASLVTHGTALFGVPATRVYGTGGDFTVTGWTSTRDPGISPFKPILDPRGPMVVLNNAYTSQRFPVVYLNPLYDTLPQLILGDFTSYPAGSGFVDRHGNLYAPDSDWSRVLIYKTPLVRLMGCGNGVLDSGEECDDGNSDPSDGCTNVCTICGNGVVSPGEECDDGDLVNGDGCSKSCTREVPVCGNGVVEAGEECDDGNTKPSDGCTNACTICGNGIVTRPEQCDDGNLADGDGCSSSCVYETPVCGNGVVEFGEECDDGNSDPSDGCTNACAICGNGIVSRGEQCDDGNLVAGDGCAKDCTYELIPGNGAGSLYTDRRACQLEWALLTTSPQATDSRGRPSSTQTCKDNDLGCDSDPAAGVCEFQVVTCLNNVDPNLPACPPLGVGQLQLRQPQAFRDPTNYNSFSTALADLRSPLVGSAGLTLPLSPTQTDLCTAPFPVRVALGGPTHALAGRVVLATRTVAASPARAAPRDIDTLTLICTP